MKPILRRSKHSTPSAPEAPAAPEVAPASAPVAVVVTTESGAPQAPVVVPSAPTGEPPAGTWCYAPSTALYFDPLGHVFPCCTGRYPLGSLGGPNGQSLPEIWNGAKRSNVVDAVARGDLSLGCAGCALTAAGSGRSAALAVHFDRWADEVGAWPVDLEFALSNTCNLQCEMCNGDLSSAIRSQREHRPPLPTVYDDRFFADLEAFLPHAKRIAFKGGEPFLAREARRVMEMLLEIGSEAQIKVTTNGTVWNDRIESLVRDLRMEPIVSIDALDPALLERVRVGVDAAELWQNIERFHRTAAEGGRPLTLSYCLMTETWQELRPLLREAERLGGTYLTVAFVDQPLPMSLLSLAPGRLQEIHEAMDEQAVEIPIADRDLTTMWERALDWVRYCRDHANEVVDGVPVVLLPPEPTEAPPLSDEFVRVATRELEAWSPLAPLVVAVEDGMIRGIDHPAWLPSSWTVERFVGRTSDELPAILGELLDLELTLHISSMEARSASAALYAPDGVPAVRALMLGTSEGERIRIAVDPERLRG